MGVLKEEKWSLNKYLHKDSRSTQLILRTTDQKPRPLPTDLVSISTSLTTGSTKTLIKVHRSACLCDHLSFNSLYDPYYVVQPAEGIIFTPPQSICLINRNYGVFFIREFHCQLTSTDHRVNVNVKKKKETVACKIKQHDRDELHLQDSTMNKQQQHNTPTAKVRNQTATVCPCNLENESSEAVKSIL